MQSNLTSSIVGIKNNFVGNDVFENVVFSAAA